MKRGLPHVPDVRRAIHQGSNLVDGEAVAKDVSDLLTRTQAIDMVGIGIADTYLTMIVVEL